jgi:hypothetical protein
MNHEKTAAQLLATATELLATAKKLLAKPNPPARPQPPRPRRRRPHPNPLTEAQIAEEFAKLRAHLATL